MTKNFKKKYIIGNKISYSKKKIKRKFKKNKIKFLKKKIKKNLKI